MEHEEDMASISESVFHSPVDHQEDMTSISEPVFHRTISSASIGTDVGFKKHLKQNKIFDLENQYISLLESKVAHLQSQLENGAFEAATGNEVSSMLYYFHPTSNA